MCHYRCHLDTHTSHAHTEPPYIPPVALQMMHNALLTTFTGTRGYNISITNFPLPYTDETRVSLVGFWRFDFRSQKDHNMKNYYQSRVECWIMELVNPEYLKSYGI